MRIILISLPHPYLNQPDAQVPLGILYLASVLERQGCEVGVRNYSAWTDEQAIEDLTEADLYGITVTSLELPQANRFAAAIKRKFVGAAVILGGPGVYTEEFVDWSAISSICKGDGELAILKIVEDFNNGRLKRVYVGETVLDLDQLPFPARHLLGGNLGGNIFAYNRNYAGNGSTTILSNRGCPFRCSFCGSPGFTLNNKVRYRSARNIADEVHEVVSRFGIRQFRFSDDMFTANKKLVFEMCRLLEPMNIVWRISCRVKPLDEDLLKAIYGAGCREVSLGVESFDDQVLRVLCKGTTARDNAVALERCARLGFRTRILFMIRTPGQTAQTVPTNIEWLRRVPYDILCCTTFVPIPGSHIWAHPERYGIEILNRNLDDYNFYFFGPDGENEIKDIIRIKGRSLQELNAETVRFRDFLKSTGKLNKG